MFKENTVLAQLKIDINKNKKIVKGIIEAPNKRNAFLVDDEGNSYYVSQEHRNRVLDGDTITAFIEKDGKREVAIPQELHNYKFDTIIGCVIKKGNVEFVNFNGRRDTGWYFLADSRKHKLKEGEWIKARLSKHPFHHEGKSAVKLVKRIALNEDLDLPWKLAIEKNNINTSLPKTTPSIKEYEEILKKEIGKRESMTDLVFFTIDAESTRDIDDALNIEKTDSGYTLRVAIADPSSFVKENSDVDILAKEKLFSYYLPNQTISMLPRELSEKYCSLIEGEDRIVLVCTMNISESGEVTDFNFQESIIKSDAKLTYNGVTNYLESNDDNYSTKEIRKKLDTLKDLSELRKKWRKENATGFNETSEYSFVVNEKHEVLDIKEVKLSIAHQIVTESMIVANTCVAKFISKNSNAGIFNFHNGFNVLREEKIKTLLKEHDITDLFNLEEYRKINKLICDKDICGSIEEKLKEHYVRSDFSAQSKTHFGLGFTEYATFTSPIRKYGDIINHRIIKQILSGVTTNSFVDEDILERLVVGISKQKFADKEISSRLYSRHLAPDIGKDFEVKLIGINPFGINLKVLSNGAFGFIPMKRLKEKEIKVNDVGTLLKINEKENILLGTTLKVKLKEIEQDSNKLVFDFI
jgi:exoribonuclease-2